MWFGITFFLEFINYSPEAGAAVGITFGLIIGFFLVILEFAIPIIITKFILAVADSQTEIKNQAAILIPFGLLFLFLSLAFFLSKKLFRKYFQHSGLFHACILVCGFRKVFT